MVLMMWFRRFEIPEYDEMGRVHMHREGGGSFDVCMDRRVPSFLIIYETLE